MNNQQQHPITPPLELRKQWRTEAPPHRDGYVLREEWLIDRAAQWGANTELEACVEWLQDPDLNVDTCKLLQARRPKPPTLKEQALLVLDDADLDAAHENILRRALEALPDD